MKEKEPIRINTYPSDDKIQSHESDKEPSQGKLPYEVKEFKPSDTDHSVVYPKKDK